MAQDPVTGGRRFLVVHAHPLADSLAAALRDAAIDGIAAAGHESDLVDLYADGFDPCLSIEERAAFASPDYAPPPEIAGYCERLVSADGLVLVFPQWWFGMPAILKGFIDRVFVPGLTFAVNPATRVLEPRLSRLRTCHVVTTTNSPWRITELYMRNPVRRQIRNGTIGICGKGVSFRMLSMYGLDKATRAECERFIARVRGEFSRG